MADRSAQRLSSAGAPETASPDDESPDDKSQAARRAAMSILSRASEAELAKAWDGWPQRPARLRVRGPETGLVMVRGRIGGGGAPFNLGETTVTRATIRLDGERIGHGYVLGTSHRHAELAAIFDALWQDEARRPRVEEALLAPVRLRLQKEATIAAEQMAATRVEFFTMVRGED